MKSDNLTKQVRKLQRNVNDLNLDLQAIQEEHDKYVLGGSKDEAIEWFNSLPIETLRDSLDREKKAPRTKYSLQDMRHKFALRRLHEQKKDQLEKEQSKLNLARIDHIAAQIKKIEDGTYEQSGSSKRKIKNGKV